MTPLFTDFPDAAFSSKELEHILDQLWTEQIIFFPVRHHSPACAWHLMKLIQKERPCAVLVEGPESFTPLIPLILHERTRPPFAVYTQYVYESTPKFSAGEAPSQEEKKWPAVRFAAYYPFCEYSPEFVALREGQAVGARLKFIDLNYPDQVLSEIHEDDESAAPRIDSLLEERHLQHSAYLQELARRTGCRDTNDLWDHLFEANYQAISTEIFIRHVAAYCYMARLYTPPEELCKDGIETREQYMAFAIADEVKRRRKSAQKKGKIVVVTGGFHTVVLPGLVHAKPKKPKSGKQNPDTSQEALIRYSFDQLDALNGYAAGMPSPQYYQCVWTHRDLPPKEAFRKIANEVLVELGRLTREENMQIALSTADEIAALQQATLLAQFRGHPGPMREDVLDGIRSCFVKGAMEAEGAILLSLIQNLLSGNQIGDIPAEAGIPPIISDFRSKAREFRLEVTDAVRKTIALDLYRKARHRKLSRFFHSLTFMNVSFGILLAGPDFVRGANLHRIQEQWEYFWTPRTESSLIDVAVYGSTIEEAAVNLLKERIAALEQEGQGRNALAAVNILITACQMGLQQHARELLMLIAEQIVEEPFFASAVQAASQLLLLWFSREPLEAHTLPEIPDLMRSAYLRACYLVSSLVQCPDEQVPNVLNAFKAMRELLTGIQEEWLDPEVFWESARLLIGQPECHTTICGGMAGLLYSEGHLADADLLKMICGYLGGSGGTWQQKVGFLRGLLFTCREVAWQNREFIQNVDELLNGWEEKEFVAALPDLRLAFADLTPKETDQVAELVARLHGQRIPGDLIEREVSESTILLCAKMNEIVMESLRKDQLHPLFEETEYETIDR